MKVLVATKQTQGLRASDFCCALEGEMVMFPPLECDCGSIDASCGCRRSMAGLVSHRATTTVVVAEREELYPETYFKLISEGHLYQGYVTRELMNDREVNAWLHDVTFELVQIAGTFAPGTVLERRDGFVTVRQEIGKKAR